jgi:hypothetical protein
VNEEEDLIDINSRDIGRLKLNRKKQKEGLEGLRSTIHDCKKTILVKS